LGRLCNAGPGTLPGMPFPPDPDEGPAPQRFELTVQPASALQAWHARLCSADGEHFEFASPIELLRHLAQLGEHQPPPGHLR